MKAVSGILLFIVLAGLSGCGKKPSAEAFKSSIGMTKDQIESLYGRPDATSLEATVDHPGGYWVYKISAAQDCTLRFDIPHRVLGADC